MLNYCATSVVDLFGPSWAEQDAQWWVWMFGCIEPCAFCDAHQPKGN